MDSREQAQTHPMEIAESIAIRSDTFSIFVDVMKEGMSKMVHRRQKRSENIIEINGWGDKNDDFFCCCCRCWRFRCRRVVWSERLGWRIDKTSVVWCATRALLNFRCHHRKGVLAASVSHQPKGVRNCTFIVIRKEKKKKERHTQRECIISNRALCRYPKLI